MDSLRGQFLLASAAMGDPNFAGCVLLMLRHEPDGSLGVIVNRALAIDVASAIGDAVESAAGVTQPLFRGGPCEGPLLALHDDPMLESEAVLPGVRCTSDRIAIEQLMASRSSPVKYVAGYAGWGPLQLEDEIEEGAWIIVPASPTWVFSDRGDTWSRLSSRARLGGLIDPEHIPDDPSMN